VRCWWAGDGERRCLSGRAEGEATCFFEGRAEKRQKKIKEEKGEKKKNENKKKPPAAPSSH
jgi:hypothetical protein